MKQDITKSQVKTPMMFALPYSPLCNEGFVKSID